MDHRFKTPPSSPSAMSTPQELAKKLTPLIGMQFPLSQHARTNGANWRKLVASRLLDGLPEEAAAGSYEILPPDRKGVPKILRELVDTYIVTTGHSYNLQIWNRYPATRDIMVEYSDGSALRSADVRLVFGKVCPSSNVIESVVICSPEYIEAIFGKFGKPTIKQQMIISTKTRNEILSAKHPFLFYPDVQEISDKGRLDLSTSSILDSPSDELLYSMNDILKLVCGKLVGAAVPMAQTKNKGQWLERHVSELLGYKVDDSQLLAGGYPDIRHQGLEVKVQESPTVDLGKYSPAIEEPIPECQPFSTKSTRYLIALTNSASGSIEGFILSPGAFLGDHFSYVADQSFKCQRSIPMEFFSASEKGQARVNPPYRR